MINILLPMCHPQTESEHFPRLLKEIDGKPMIQVVVENILSRIKRPSKLIFVVNKSDCDRHHLDNVLRLIASNCEIIRAIETTKGAACSCLMAIDHIDKNKPLIILNSNQVLTTDIEKALTYFESNSCDAGTLTFESVHPKWSFVRCEGDEVVEAAEKRPISKDAIAGFYYFREAGFYFESVMTMIKKDVNFQGQYFNAPALNELILRHKKVRKLSIDNSDYYNFSDDNQIQKFMGRPEHEG